MILGRRTTPSSRPGTEWMFQTVGYDTQRQGLDFCERLLSGMADTAGMPSIQRPSVSRSNSTFRSNAAALAARFMRIVSGLGQRLVS